MPEDTFVDKTTTVKSGNPVEFIAEPFAKGYRVRVKVAFDPENSTHLDQFLLKKNNFQAALNGFIENTIKGTLQSNLIIDPVQSSVVFER